MTQLNPTVQKLAEQAGIDTTDFENCPVELYGAEQQLNKFAELIVRECAKVSKDDITDGDACCTNTAYRIASQIKKHFGIKETKREQIDKAMREAFKNGVDLSGRDTP
jgi:hypothetical protein